VWFDSCGLSSVDKLYETEEILFSFVKYGNFFLHNAQMLHPSFRRIIWPDWMFGENFKPLHQHRILFRGYFQRLFYGTWPVEGTVAQSLVKKQETIPFP
jgi:hypothetical protein